MAEKDLDTEQKIMAAASEIFHKKGFASTTTRDIAEAAGTNLALVNYYFRSKKNLFILVMHKTIQSFMSTMMDVLNDSTTSLKQKVSTFVNAYMDLLEKEPNMVFFILTAVREHPEEHLQGIKLLDKLQGSVLLEQFQESMKKGEIPPINPVHLMLNLVGLTVFPFIGQPMITYVSGIPKEKYIAMIQERRRLIPLWIESMLSVT